MFTPTRRTTDLCAYVCTHVWVQGCITSFGSPEDEGYIPPWTYAPEEMRTPSVNDARRAALRAKIAEEAGGVAVKTERKSIETAQAEMRAMLQNFPGCTVSIPRLF